MSICLAFRTLIFLLAIVISSSCSNSEKGEKITYEPCENFYFNPIGTISKEERTSLEEYLRSQSYESDTLEKVILFQRNYPGSKTVYIHSIRIEESWETTVPCNSVYLRDEKLEHLTRVCENIIVEMSKMADFNEISFFCSFQDLPNKHTSPSAE